MQLQHQNTPLLKHEKQLIVACNYIASPANLGMISRNAEAFGVQQILLAPANEDFLESNRFKRTARNSETNIQFKVIASLAEEISKLADAGYTISALELTKNSKSIQQTRPSNKMMIVLGNENHGVPEEVLSLCHQAVHIPQFGKNSSINVAQALGICLYEFTNNT